MSRCPNKNLPEWKRMVETLGELGAYKMYAANNMDIPTNTELDTLLTEQTASRDILFSSQKTPRELAIQGISQTQLKTELGISSITNIGEATAKVISNKVSKANNKAVLENKDFRYEFDKNYRGESAIIDVVLYKFNGAINAKKKYEERAKPKAYNYLNNDYQSLGPKYDQTFTQQSLFAGKKAVRKLTTAQKYIAHKEAVLERVNLDMQKFDINTMEFHTLQERALKLETDIRALRRDSSISKIIDNTKTDLEYIEKILNRAAGISDASVANTAIARIFTELSLWTNPSLLDDMLEGNISPIEGGQTPIQAGLMDIVGKAAELHIRASKQAKQNLAKIASVDFQETVTADEIAGPQKDIGFWASKFMDASRSGRKLGMAIDIWKRKAEYSTRLEMEDIEKQIDDAFAGLTQTEFNQLLQKDGKGNLTGRLVHYISSKYYETRESLRPEKEYVNPVDEKRAWKKYFDFVRENNIMLDPRILFYEEYNKIRGYNQKEFNETDRVNLIKELKSHLGDTLYDRMYKRAEKVHLEFLIQRKNAVTQAKLQENITGQSEDAYMDMWDRRMSPYRYVEYINSGTKPKIQGEYINIKGGEFTITMPRKFDSEGKATGWYDNQYFTIMSNPKLKKAYETSMDVLQLMRGYLPQDAKHNLKINSLPAIKKKWIQEMSWSQAKQTLGNLKTTVKEAILDDSDEYIAGNINVATGKIDRKLAVKYLNQDMPINERSFDLPKILKMYATMGTTYKHKSKVEMNFRIASELLNQMGEIKTAATGDPRKIKRMDADQITSGELVDMKAQLEYSMDTFYGMFHPKLLTKNKKLSPEEKTEVSLLEEKQLNLIADNENGLIDDVVFRKEYEELEKKINAIGKHYSMSNMGNMALQWNQMRGMGWNIPGALGNVLVGKMSNIIHASRGEDFTHKELNRARLITTSLNPSTTKKVEAMMIRFNVLKQLLEEAYYKGNPNQNKKSLLGQVLPYELYRKGEYSIQGEVFVAMMLHTKVKDASGKEVSLWEAHTNDGNWDTSKMGDNKEWETGTTRFAFENRITQVIKRLHGNYDPLSSVLIKKELWGRALMQFRSWLPEAIATRWEGQKYDALLGREVKGRWRSYGAYFSDKGFVPALLGVLKGIASKKHFSQETTEGFTELDAANMRANMMELMMALSLTATAILVKAAFKGGDDDEDEAAATFLLNIISRLMGDITFYVDPAGAERITRNLVPVMSLVPDTWNVLIASGNFLTGNDEINGGYLDGHSRLLKASAKLTPGGASAYNLYMSTIREF